MVCYVFRVCCSAFHGSSARSLAMTFPASFLQSSLCLAASHVFFLLSNLTASSCTSSFHLIFHLPMGLLPPSLSSRICFWDSFVEPYYIPSLNWYLFDPIILLLNRSVVNGTEQNNGATERNSISQIVTAWGFRLSIVLSPVFRFGKGRWCSCWENELKTKGIENTQLLLIINCIIFNFSGIPRPAL